MLIPIMTLAALILTYFFIRPFLKTKAQSMKILKVFLFLIPVAILTYWIVMYFTYYDKPESFEIGVEQLKTNTAIKNKIGTYETYTYFDKDLPKKTDNPATFKVSLKGAIASIYLTCEMEKNKTNQWHIVKITQDSLRK